MSGGSADRDDWRAILVALDASPLSQAGLELAARLARRLGVPVSAVCVEDADIARLASHPGAVAICTITARARPLALSRETIAAALSGQRRAAQAAVEAVKRLLIEEEEEARPDVEPTPAEIAFLSRRGPVARELHAALAEAAADLLVLGSVGQARARWTRERGVRLGSTARALVTAADGPRRVLVVRRPLAARPPVFACWDGSEAAERALETACAVARAADTGVAALVFGGDTDDERRIALVAARFGVPLRLQTLPPLTTARLVRAADFPQALLVLPAETAMTLGLSTADLVDLLSCSVLLVR